MTPAEVSALLLAVRAVDDRVVDDDARLAAWCAILDPRLTLDHGKAAVIQHYGSQTRPIMPADINLYGKQARERDAQERDRRALTSGEGVPMPPEVKARLDVILGRR